jgi:hypothetical protein
MYIVEEKKIRTPATISRTTAADDVTATLPHSAPTTLPLLLDPERRSGKHPRRKRRKERKPEHR